MPFERFVFHLVCMVKLTFYEVLAAFCHMIFSPKNMKSNQPHAAAALGLGEFVGVNTKAGI